MNSEFVKSRTRTDFAKNQTQLTSKRSSLCRSRKLLPNKKLPRQAPLLYSRGIFRIKRSDEHQNLKGEMDGVNKNKNNYSFESGDRNVNEEEDIDEDRNKKYVEEKSSSCSTDDELENTNAKSTRKNASEILQRTQAIEAEFYERLIELRKENETEVAKIMNRKNAELIAVQKAAEMKHCELRQAIDKLENQLSDTVNNADQIKRSSEEKMNQLQSVMNKQFENLLKQSNEQREFLIQEHEKTLKDLQNKNESTFKELEVNKSFVIELESKMELQHNQIKSLKEQLTNIMTERNELEESLKVKTEKEKETLKKLKQLQCDLNELTDRYKTLESKYNMCLEDYNQELKQIRSDHAKRVCAMELERMNNEKQYETNLEKIKDEFNTKLEESRLSYERLLVTEVKEAETRGYEKCLLIKSDEITALQKTIKETKELNSNDEVNWFLHDKFKIKYRSMCLIKYQVIISQLKCEITKLNKIIEKLKNIDELKENNFLTIITKLQKKQLNDTLNKTNSIQTYFTNEFNEKLLNSIIQWKKQQLNEIILLIKQKEFNHLEIIFKEKENIIRNELLLKIENIQNEKNQIIETLTNALNLSKLDIVKLETELKEARRIAMTEVELRREQLSEISLARELERKELISKHENHLNEEQCKNQETILRLQEQHAEELKTISSQANEKLLGIEKEYKIRLMEANKRLNESQEKIINLDMILQKALQEKRNTQETLSESFQSEIEQMKNKQKQEVLILKEAISKERNRARLAEISLRQQEKAWNDMKTRWHEERIAQLGNSLPIESRTHMEATIEALRLQVNLLKKRITVMEEDRETNITYPLKLQFSDQDVSLLSEDSVQNESPVKDQPEANQDNLEKCEVNNNSVPLGDNSRRRIATECTNLQTNLDAYSYKATCSEDWLLSGH
ncbi:unnamed protein product [Schistosoma margrebowiei]|uniref:Uncharacterized protein n=1 Tax=Schistosoma margrebowiei TaxID=48269 RepID=A0A183ML27_9TREM|nr:unnamed protein product [Schistosoma margrebowiei]